jgi:hypothetical protein
VRYVPSALEVAGFVAILAGAAYISWALLAILVGVILVMSGTALARMRTRDET